MEKLKHVMNLISTGDESSGPTKPMGEASVPAGISEHFTRTPDKSRTERLKELRSQCLTDLEYEIKSSQEHWTEEKTEATSDDEELEAANREVFERLLEQWRCPRTGLCFFHDWGENLQVGRKITEGGQAEIFEAEIEGDPGYVVKVFKKESSLKDLERQWPRGMFQPQHLASSSSSVATSRSRSIDKANQASVSTHFIFDNCCFIHGATLLRNGRFAFVLERYWGDLRRFIDLQMEAGYRQPFEENGAHLYVMLEIAKGMRTLHGRGILHRDLKASNILVRHVNGDLSRFSLSYRWNMRHVVLDVADFESSSAIVGTGFWRAPEVLSALKDRTSMRDSTPWTEKSDVYSYAMTCYEVLTGRIPFEGVDGINNDRVINGERPPWYEVLTGRIPFEGVDGINNDHVINGEGLPCYDSSWLDSGLQALVEKCWHANPSQRPNFLQIIDELEDVSNPKYWEDSGVFPPAPDNRKQFTSIRII